MNRNQIKAYAPQARRDFIRAVTDRAALYGLAKEKTEPVVEHGDVAVIGGRPYPRSVAVLRKRLQERADHEGFDHVMEAMAYTWFNRLVAIRYMELHGYLDHGFRVLSHPEGRSAPEILEHAEEVDLPGLRREAVIDLKLAGNREAELYRKLLIAQCNALHDAMPFLFERIDDETELLLPDKLLQTDSIDRKLVKGIDEEDWQEVEIIGWIYQFYISEKKEEVIGKVVASEDIPAATQLFTPNWIVKYLVQNTLGHQWLATYPQSALRQQMQYYVEPPEQTREVQEQLKSITPTSLNPEELTLLDPACGSGHILVEAYDLFKAIYQERGYRAKDIPELILQKNLFGLEIDGRAAQLAAFALMMKARADDRRIFDSKAKPNILAFQDSQGLSADDITHALNSPILNEPSPPKKMLCEEIEDEKAGLFSKKNMGMNGQVAQDDIASLLALFENAKTFGSLIQVPPKLAATLPEIERRLNDVLKNGDLLSQGVARHVLPQIPQGVMLARRFDVVVANPPYMGSKGMNSLLKTFGRQNYPNGKADIYAMFMERLVAFAVPNGWVGIMAPFTWMFISSYEALRTWLIGQKAIVTLVQPEYHAFFESAYVPICALVVRNTRVMLTGDYFRLTDFYGEDIQATKLLEGIDNPDCGWRFLASASDFKKIPGNPIAYWASDLMRSAFERLPPLSNFADVRVGMHTGSNSKFVRHWFEVGFDNIRLDCTLEAETDQLSEKWYPYNKGGDFRKWEGNRIWVVNWKKRGRDIHEFHHIPLSHNGAPVRAKSLQFRESITWSFVSSSFFGVRYSPPGSMLDVGGSSAFPHDSALIPYITGFLCSRIAFEFLQILNPTLNFQVGNVCSLPLYVQAEKQQRITALAELCISLSRMDWDGVETSWGFHSFPVLRQEANTLQESQESADAECLARFHRVKELEEENNRLFIKAYGLQGEILPEVPDDQITVYRPNREEDIRRLLSYGIGCMMGRYSLDKPGLIYANSGNQDFDPVEYKTFRADDDGIIPLLETDWGIRDDATSRIVEFIGVMWPKEYLDENLKFIADSLGLTGSDQPRDTIRRYLATGFYKHHLSMYKRRPIYWLFSSGKQRAFQCLGYLHRYHEGTLSRMRTEYVIPLQGMIASRIEHLSGDIAAATSTAQRKKLEKEREILLKQQAELHAYEEKLRHYADKKISLELDDGVKVNYGKFGDLLAEVRAVTGGDQD